jgi:hypothetical protein
MRTIGLLRGMSCPSNTRPTSDHVGGVGRDARHIAEHLAARSRRRVGHAASTPSRKALP